MDEEKKRIRSLRTLYNNVKCNSNYYLFENFIGNYFGLPDTAQKPEFEVMIWVKIKSKDEQK